jgi:response regulator RpfG family c-di-GMP phosphodiesterase
VILLDLNLPKCSGDEVLDHIRHTDRCKNIPVMVITSSDSPRDKLNVSGLGASKYFRKRSSRQPGNLNAMYSPEYDPPLTATTIYCFPSTIYVMGEPLCAAGIHTAPTSFPVRLS